MLTKADWAAIKKENGEHLKNEFLEEAKKNKEKLGVILCENQYSPKMLLALKEMAKEDVYPDGRFGAMYREFEQKYNPYPVQMARYDAFRHALDDGLIDEDTYQKARIYYGKLWNYVGD